MTSPAERRRDLWAFFALTWAAAVLFHLAGNTRLAPEWGRASLGLAALLVLSRPRNPWLALPLSAAVVVNVWLEAPILGNHWLLHGFVAVLVAGAVILGRGDPDAVLDRLVGPARLILLAFYAFAAFAKLNTDFFEPTVSCAVFYLRESADSWGAHALVEGLPTGVERSVAFAVAGIELSIPVLLALRRTRHAGVIVALLFHYVLAFDRTHQFFDFSSVLATLFLLFLDESVRLAVVDRFRAARDRVEARWKSGPELAGILALVAAAGVVVLASGPGRWPAPKVLREVGVWVWLIYGIVLIVAVIRAVRRGGSSSSPLAAVRPAGILWLLPLLAMANGLTPYLELKTGHGWNMYSNLVVADGESNHLLVRRSIALSDAQSRLVEIVETDDPRLEFYVSGGWLLAETQLVDYLADRPGVRVTGRVGNEVVQYEGGLGGGRAEWRQKFQVFRAVDAEGDVSCQPSFGPAR